MQQLWFLSEQNLFTRIMMDLDNLLHFSFRLGAAKVNLTENDPWSEEFLWTVNKDTLAFCLYAIPNGGSPIISSLEIRPLPQGSNSEYHY